MACAPELDRAVGWEATIKDNASAATHGGAAASIGREIAEPPTGGASYPERCVRPQLRCSASFATACLPHSRPRPRLPRQRQRGVVQQAVVDGDVLQQRRFLTLGHRPAGEGEQPRQLVRVRRRGRSAQSGCTPLPSQISAPLIEVWSGPHRSARRRIRAPETKNPLPATRPRARRAPHREPAARRGFVPVPAPPLPAIPFS